MQFQIMTNINKEQAIRTAVKTDCNYIAQVEKNTWFIFEHISVFNLMLELLKVEKQLDIIEVN